MWKEVNSTKMFYQIEGMCQYNSNSTWWRQQQVSRIVIGLTYHGLCCTNVLIDRFNSLCSSLNLLNNCIWVISNICFGWISYWFRDIYVSYHIPFIWWNIKISHPIFMHHRFNTFTMPIFIGLSTNNCPTKNLIICIYL